MAITRNNLAGRREIDGYVIFFRSKWEANYARYLEFLRNHGKITEWMYEPETFWFHAHKRGCVSYLPDFKIIEKDGSHNWVEVKGYMDNKSKTKLARFAKYYPNEKIKVVDGNWFKRNNAQLRGLIREWE